MAQFNLENYETVEERITRFYEAYPDGRIMTYDYSSEDDRAHSVWRVRAEIFLNVGDQAAELPKSVGHAFEVDGAGMTQKASALETCETSAIGRALANMGMSGNRRTTRDEMEKVKRIADAPVPSDLDVRLKACESQAELDDLYAQALAGGWWTPEVQAKFKKRKGELK